MVGPAMGGWVMNVRVMAVLSGIACLIGSEAQADIQQLDISGQLNNSFAFSTVCGCAMPDGVTTTGNTGNPLASLSFNVPSSAGNNIWEAFSNNDTLDITGLNIPNVTNVYTL